MMRLHYLPMLCALLAPVNVNAEPVFDAFGDTPVSTQPEPDFSAFQKRLDDLDSRLSKLERAQAPPPSTPQLWTVNGKDWATEADLRRTHPGVRFPHDPPAVSGVTRSNDPFVQGSVSGCASGNCSTIQDTGVRRAGTPLMRLTFRGGR